MNENVYRIPEGHSLLIKLDGTFTLIPADGYIWYEGPIFPLGIDDKFPKPPT
jgi:hypothetical protein